MSNKFKLQEEPKIFYNKNKTAKDLSLLDSGHFNKLLLNTPRKKAKNRKK